MAVLQKLLMSHVALLAKIVCGEAEVPVRNQSSIVKSPVPKFPRLVLTLILCGLPYKRLEIIFIVD